MAGGIASPVVLRATILAQPTYDFLFTVYYYSRSTLDASLTAGHDERACHFLSASVQKYKLFEDCYLKVLYLFIKGTKHPKVFPIVRRNS